MIFWFSLSVDIGVSSDCRHVLDGWHVLFAALFVYHAEAMENGQPHEVFETMEAKLLRIIMNPAMMAAWLFGLILLLRDGFWASAGIWMHIKLGAVIFMSGYHGFLAAMRKKFLSGVPPRSSRFFRLINEIPPILTIVIVIMVIVRPF